MAKYGGKSTVGKRPKSKFDYSKVKGTGQPISEIVGNATKGKPDPVVAQTRGKTISDVLIESQTPTVLSADDVIAQGAAAEGITTGEYRQRAAEDATEYNKVQEAAGQPVEITTQDTGLMGGPGYKAKQNGMDAVPPAVRINELSKKLVDQTITAEEQEELVGFMPNTAKARELRGETEAFDVDNATASLRTGKVSEDKFSYQEKLDLAANSHNMGKRVGTYMNERFEFGMSPVEETEISAKLKEEGTDPSSLKEWFANYATTQAALKEQGLPDVLPDLSLHAVLAVVRENMRRASDSKSDEARQAGMSQQELIDEGISLRAGDHARIGRYIESAMGVQGTPTTSAIAGAVAMHSVVGALNAKGKNPIFIENKKGSFDFNPHYTDRLEAMSNLTSVIIKETRKDVRTSHNKDIISKIAAHRKAEFKRKKAVEYGKSEFYNTTIDNMNAQGHRIDNKMINVMNVLAGMVNNETGGSLIDKLIGIKSQEGVKDGVLNNREPTRRKRDENGKFIPNANYVEGSNNPQEKYEYEMERYLGNNMKDIKFNETMDWAENHAGDTIYYDYFLGSNNRFYAEQTLGNPQSDKLARAMLQSKRTWVINLKSPKQVLVMKAGIMKKAGFEFEGTTTDKLNVANAARAYEFFAPKITEAMDKLLAGDGSEFITMAKDGEKMMAVSAMIEADAMSRAIKNDQNQYASNFYSEIDGVANGLGHNAMQAGDPRVAVATKLNPVFNAIYKDKGYTADGADVYYLAGNGMKEILKDSVNGYSSEVTMGLDVIGLNTVSALRSFAKSPLMIFGYGAGNNKIKGITVLELEEMLEKNPEMRTALEEVLGDEMTVAEFNQQVSEAMLESLSQNFPLIKELSSIMSALAEHAVLQGIDPSTIAVEGNYILYGLTVNQVDTERSFKDQGLDITVKEKVLKPGARTQKSKHGNWQEEVVEGTTEMKPWGELGLAGALKAAAQAGVLVTHNNDGVNIGRSFNATAGEIDAFQIFDGVLVHPMQAEAMAKRLNEDFVAINKQHNNVQKLMDTLEAKGMKMRKLPQKLQRRILDIMKARKELQKIIGKVNQFFWDD